MAERCRPNLALSRRRCTGWQNVSKCPFFQTASRYIRPVPAFAQKAPFILQAILHVSFVFVKEIHALQHKKHAAKFPKYPSQWKILCVGRKTRTQCAETQNDSASSVPVAPVSIASRSAHRCAMGVRSGMCKTMWKSGGLQWKTALFDRTFPPHATKNHQHAFVLCDAFPCFFAFLASCACERSCFFRFLMRFACVFPASPMRLPCLLQKAAQSFSF